jgi:GDP-L-fucose synthase
LWADDLARAAILRLSEPCGPDLLNVGSGVEISLRALADIVANEIQYTGAIWWDATKPDGTPRRVLDCTEFLRTGWVPSVTLSEGIRLAYADFKSRI